MRLGLVSDGFNPFGNMSTTHSIWPVVLMPYNFLSWMIMKDPFMILSLIIPGCIAARNDIDVYLQPLAGVDLFYGMQGLAPLLTFFLFFFFKSSYSFMSDCS
jgi:hypothetical protein